MPGYYVHDGPRAKPRSDAEIAFVKTALTPVQEKSIAQNREYCGFVGLNIRGDYIVSEPNKGRAGHCDIKEPPLGLRVLASYHTHGAYSKKFDSEIPSSDDLLGDIESGIDGYILTPGGRLWYNDHEREQAVLLCGQGCISADPDFIADQEFPVAESYTPNELEAREALMNE